MQRNQRQIRHISFMIFSIPSCLPFHRQFPAPPILKVPLRASLPIDARSNARSFLPSLTARPIRSLMKPILRKQERKELPPSRKGQARAHDHGPAQKKRFHNKFDHDRSSIFQHEVGLLDFGGHKI